MPRRLVLFLLLDAFRWDYPARTRFLSRLWSEGGAGRLREPFGFLPRASYFGGLTPEQVGYTNMYAFDPTASPFRSARFLAQVRELDATGESLLRKKFGSHVGQFLNAYEALDTGPATIPLQVVPFFRPAERAAPWAADAGYSSLFHRLDERGLAWYADIYPHNLLSADRSDAAIVERTCRALDGGPAFAAVHLQELDGIAHTSGPDSAAITTALHRVDEHVERLIGHIMGQYDDVWLVACGDHGMVPVIAGLDLDEHLRQTNLAHGIDYWYFLDSTMARFWFARGGARRQVEAVLATVPGGHMLTEAELDALHAAGCQPSNGELFFLLDPGYVIAPSFFGAAPRGMHGYHPDVPDNQGAFVLWSSRQPLPASVGVVDAEQVFSTCLELLGLTPPVAAPPSVVALTRQSRRPPGFTLTPDERAREHVSATIDHAVERIQEELPDCSVIVLSGSFGRGEGGVARLPDGSLVLVNDLDFFVATAAPHRRLDEVSHMLASELALDFVDLARMPATLESPSILGHDLKYGSSVLVGDREILTRLPGWSIEEIPLTEGLNLLLNRAAGLLGGMANESLASATTSDRARRYLINQIVKVGAAMGDWLLLRQQSYTSSYRVRAARYQYISTAAASIGAVEAEFVLWAYATKVLPDYDLSDAMLARRFDQALGGLARTIPEAIGALSPHRAPTVTDALAGYWERLRDAPSPTDETLPRGGSQLACAAALLSLQDQERPSLLTLATHILADLQEDEFGQSGDTGVPQAPDWSRLRHAAFAAWERACHT